MRRTPLLAAALVPLLGLVGACGTDDADGTAATPGAVDGTATTEAAPPTTVGATTTWPPATEAPADTTTVPPQAEAEVPEVTAPTVDELLAREETLVIAHAGGDYDHPHSTAFAFAESAAAGADVLEMDVQLSGDGVLVVQHDDTVDKTTGATGPVADRTLEELQALDNAHWFSPECWPCHDLPAEAYVHRGVRTGDREPPAGYGPDDFRIPTFREIATRFPDLPLDIEIKGALPGALDVVDALATELEELGREDSVVVVSFDSEVVAAFRERMPEVAVSPGVAELTAWVLGGVPLDPAYRIVQVPPSFEGTEVLNPAFMDAAAAAGVEVWSWLDDQPNQENAAFYRRLIDLGVDGIIAGRPATLADTLR